MVLNALLQWVIKTLLSFGQDISEVSQFFLIFANRNNNLIEIIHAREDYYLRFRLADYATDRTPCARAEHVLRDCSLQ